MYIYICIYSFVHIFRCMYIHIHVYGIIEEEETKEDAHIICSS